MTEPLHPSHGDIMQAIESMKSNNALLFQRIEKKVDELIKAVGDEGEDEHGAPIGTGVRGRIMRLEIAYRTMRNRTLGALAAGSILIVAIWWIIQDKVGHVLK